MSQRQCEAAAVGARLKQCETCAESVRGMLCRCCVAAFRVLLGTCTVGTVGTVGTVTLLGHLLWVLKEPSPVNRILPLVPRLECKTRFCAASFTLICRQGLIFAIGTQTVTCSRRIARLRRVGGITNSPL